MRIELRDGQWAELRERITHGQDKEIRRARVRAQRDPENHAAEGDTAALRVFISAWNVLDPEGNALPLDHAGVEGMPADIADLLIGEISPLYVPATTPNESYARLIGRLILGQRVSEEEVERLPDPDTFKDALLLSTSELRWSPQDLDATDALLLALVEKFRNAKRG